MVPLSACPVAASSLIWLLLRAHAQSYGIKVGYGAGGSAAGTVRPGEPAQPKSSSCC